MHVYKEICGERPENIGKAISIKLKLTCFQKPKNKFFYMIEVIIPNEHIAILYLHI